MTTPENGTPAPELPNEELSFGEVVSARSEALLRQRGQRVALPDGKHQLTHTWEVHESISKKFTLSRGDDETVMPGTIYTLEYTDLERAGDNGTYLFNQRGMVEGSKIAYRSLKEDMAKRRGQDPAEMHAGEILRFIASAGTADNN